MSAPSLQALDDQRMGEAHALACQAIGLSEPNPRVGCVIGSDDGRVFGAGHTQPAGQAHAEVMALRAAHAAGHDVRGATAWVTLEPCAHHGRTPPCADALIAAGLARVVYGSRDPFPAVAGAGLDRLRTAGIAVGHAGPGWEERTRELNIGFFSRIERGRPWVRLKVACSLDGQVALENGQSQWITGAAARKDGHVWRRRAGAVLTGIGTVLADDPRLDVREVATSVQPLRVILDAALRCPAQARILQPPGQTVVYHGADAGTTSLGQADHVHLVLAPALAGGIAIDHVLRDLASRWQVNELHVEAGPRLTGTFIQQGWVDELLVYLAPKLLGPGRALATLDPLGDLAGALAFEFQDFEALDQDLRLRLRRPKTLGPTA